MNQVMDLHLKNKWNRLILTVSKVFWMSVSTVLMLFYPFQIFLHAVRQVTQDLNKFNVKKHKCALCGGSGHNFDNCLKILQNDLKGAYICLCLLIHKLMAGLHK